MMVEYSDRAYLHGLSDGTDSSQALQQKRDACTLVCCSCVYRLLQCATVSIVCIALITAVRSFSLRRTSLHAVSVALLVCHCNCARSAEQPVRN
jgi:hypothetical protein